MSNREIKRLQTQEFAYLNEIDLEPFLTHEESVGSVMDILERIFNQDYCSKTGDDYLFNAIDQYEFTNYLQEKYGTKTYEFSELRIR